MSTLARTQNVPTPQPSEDEDQVIFKTPSDGSKRNSGAPSKRSSLIINNPQNSFSPSPLSLMGGESNGNQYHGHNRTESLDADIMPSFASLRLSSEPEPESSLGVNGISNGTQSSVLAPAAEIDEDGGRSRHSSGGTSSSNMDSPAIPTPAQQSKNGNVITGDRGRKFPQQGFQNGYGNQYGMDDGGINGFTNGIGMPQGAMGSFQPLLSPVMSPVMNGLHGVPSFSPPITSQYNPGDMNGSYGGVRPEDFNGNWSMQNMQNRINAQRNGPLPGGRSVQANGVNPSAAGSATFPTLNGAQQNNVNANAASLAFQQYAAQAAQGNYPAGMMSPTMTSPTFQAHQVYSPIQGPFSPYALPPPLQGGNPMYDMMSPTMSPRAGSGAVPSMTAGRGQTAQQGQRGHGYSASNPANGRDASQANGARSPVQQRNQNGQVTQQGVGQGQRGLQSPRGPGAINVGAAMTLGNHAMNQGPYSPPLAATGYGPMSPPFGGFYPQTQGISPEVLQAMAMAPYMQTTLNGIQQDPSLMALLQQGGGPSANNRKLGLYKTELCRSWEEKGSCKYGEKCQFAHGDTEQRRVERHPKYKTEICRTFWVSGSCPYGKR